jgi:manganese transport protein
MISVGYMDRHHWATDLAGGSRFGYLLLGHPRLQPDGGDPAGAVGAARHRHRHDLAQACRARYPR